MPTDLQFPTTDSTPAANREHPVVLLVDPQSMVAASLRGQLADEPDIEFHYCQHPQLAIAKAEEIKPTLIFLEPALNSDDMDGYALLTAFRNHPATRETPVVMLSLQDDPLAKRQAFELGANDFLVKLPDRIELVARIRAYSGAYMTQRQRALTLQNVQQQLDALRSAAEP